jgi:hypothetical protein
VRVRVRCEQQVSKVQSVQKIDFPLLGEHRDGEIKDFLEVSGISLAKVKMYICFLLITVSFRWKLQDLFFVSIPPAGVVGGNGIYGLE